MFKTKPNKHVIKKNGKVVGVEYRLDGNLHREDGPAVETSSGTKQWFRHGLLHRMDGPAVEYADGDREWWLNGEIHRTDGPAIEYVKGIKEWYVNGERHRKNGPACEYPDGTKQWYLNGILYSEKEYNNKMNESKLEIKTLFKGTPNERTEYRLNGLLHREDGPAVERADGSKLWYLDGRSHREGGPAIEHANGSKYWYLNGRLHREDGPAIEITGHKFWWLNGEEYSEEEFNKKISDSKLEIETLDVGTYRERTEYRLNGLLHREDGPAVKYITGDKYWYQKGKIYRMNGPAVELADGSKYWYLNDKLHREDGPAVEFTDGIKHWYLNGFEYSEKEFNRKTNKMTKLIKHTFKKNGKVVRVEYTLNGKLHRKNGPAIEWYADGDLCANGDKEWYLNGQLNREDGPACEYADGQKEWYLNNVLHREDGPAIEWADGTKEWYLKGKEYSEKEFLKLTNNEYLEENSCKYIANLANKAILNKKLSDNDLEILVLWYEELIGFFSKIRSWPTEQVLHFCKREKEYAKRILKKRNARKAAT